MIPQGKEILESGFPKYNNFTFFENNETIVQQWIYCIAVYLIDKYTGLTGLIIFALIQAMLLHIIIENRISKFTNDKFWSYTISTLITILFNMGYFVSVRPENITLILLMLDTIIIEKYKSTNNPKYLYLLPIIILAEINIHGAMWPFHFCVLLAYFFPNIAKNMLISNQAKPTKHLIPVIILMTGSLFINPYGIDTITYAFKSMDTFDIVQIKEQQWVDIIGAHGIFIILLLTVIIVLIAKHKMTSVTAYMSLGFLLIGSCSYHNTMFVTISGTYVACDMLKALTEKTNQTKLIDYLKNSMWPVIIIMIACFGATTKQALSDKYITQFKHIDGSLGAIVDYIKTEELKIDDDPNTNGNILNIPDTGPYLEYYGLKNIFCDSRPEFLNIKINKQIDGLALYEILTNNMTLRETCPENINNIEDILNTYDIKYIINFDQSYQSWPALNTYLNLTDDYKLVKTIWYDDIDERYKNIDEKDKPKPYAVLYEKVY